MAATLTDADSDTKIQVEQNADEDIIRFNVGGHQAFQILADGIGKLQGKTNTALRLVKSNDTQSSNISFSGGATTYNLGTPTADRFRLWNSNVGELFTANPNGNITLLPSTSTSSLFVRGNINVNNAFTLPKVDGTNGQVLQTDGSGTVTWATPTDNDNQTLSLATNTLSLTNGGSVDLSSYVNTDNQDLSLTNDMLSLTNDASPVDLSAYANDNTTIVQDADNDTKIQVEENADEDKIRFDLNGTERLVISQNGSGKTLLDFPNNGENLFIGTDAGSSNTSGQYNVFIGDGAGLYNTTADYNVFVGDNAGGGNTTGEHNTFLGAYAGDDNLTGDENVFIGTDAGSDNETGHYNTFVGSEAGVDNSTGSGNTILGYAAGYNNETGNDNIFLGHQAGYNETGSNKLYIENSDANSTNALIYGEFDTDLLRINGTLNINNTFSFPTVDGTNGQVLQTNGSGILSWNTLSDNDNQTLSLMTNTLSLTNGGSVDLSGYVNTDNQTLSLTTNTLSLTNGGSVDLSGYINTDNQDLTLSNHTLSLTNDASTVNLAAYANENIRLLQDTDNDTKIEVEQNADEDMIRFTVGNTERLRLENNGKLNINNAFSLPITDGTANQILQTDGNGNLTWNSVAGVSSIDVVQDSDNNTKIQVEESSNEDKIRFDIAGTEYFRMEAKRLVFGNTGSSIFIGSSAGANDNSTSNENLFIGNNAGQANTSGEDNVALGNNAAFRTTTGAYNISIGKNALRENATGDKNITLGVSALNLNKGSSNIALGYQTGWLKANGNYNILIGEEAGRGSTLHDKSNNVMIGYESGHNNDADGSVFLGYQSGYNETNGNRLYIENSNSTLPLIYGEFDNDKVKVNGDLEVTGAATISDVSGDVDVTGNVDVSGDLTVGSNDEHTTTADKKMSIVSARIQENGNVDTGRSYSGYINTSNTTKIATGIYYVELSTPFAQIPTVVVTAEPASGGGDIRHAVVQFIDDDEFKVVIYNSTGTKKDAPFNFTAIGVR